jgi:hypothetical protein
MGDGAQGVYCDAELAECPKFKIPSKLPTGY